MSRLARILAVVAIAIGGAVAVAAPASADTSDFTISSFDADYYLDIDDSGRSTLLTVETIVAEFPEYDQNHGILRHLVDEYDGHPTNLDVVSVKDENGRDYPYDTETSELFYTLQIGDADEYAHGSTTYVITYRQQNVTLFDSSADEFYWDTNGTGWTQRFDEVTARFHVSEKLEAALNGNVRCYRGTQGSTDECFAPEAQEAGDGVVFELAGTELGPGENLTIAIGFEKGTFVPRDTAATANPVFFVEIATSAIAVAIGIATLLRRATVFADGRGRPTIVAEYLPPKNASVLEAALVTKRRKKAVAAQLISMAVAHKIRIIETPATGFFASGNDYTLELLSTEGLNDDEIGLVWIFFGHTMTPGTQYTIRKNDTVVGQATYKLIQSIAANLGTRGWLRKVGALTRFLPAFFASGATALTFLMMIVMVDDERGGWLPLLVFLPSVVALIAVFAVVTRTVLTEQGAELRDYLKGLHLYITVAEKDRLRILQSPEGAERTPVDTTDKGQMLKLYERVLPYAVLFDEEKRWAKELGEYYDQEPPSWYFGTGAFSTAAFASGISSVSSSAASAFSASSSSSGGSSGGGSSGGGGGGGGGGGW